MVGVTNTELSPGHIYLDANDNTGIRIDSDKLEIEMHEVLVVVYLIQEEVIKIKQEPNKGKKVKNKNPVQDILKIGDWTGGDVVLPLPMA